MSFPCASCRVSESPHRPDCPKNFMPDSPISPAEATGMEFFSVYMANVNAGFTPPQALYILACQMTGNPGIAPGIDLPTPE